MLFSSFMHDSEFFIPCNCTRDLIVSALAIFGIRLTSSWLILEYWLARRTIICIRYGRKMSSERCVGEKCHLFCRDETACGDLTALGGFIFCNEKRR